MWAVFSRKDTAEDSVSFSPQQADLLFATAAGLTLYVMGVKVHFFFYSGNLRLRQKNDDGVKARIDEL